jgi:hypothetical protein
MLCMMNTVNGVHYVNMIENNSGNEGQPQA